MAPDGPAIYHGQDHFSGVGAHFHSFHASKLGVKEIRDYRNAEVQVSDRALIVVLFAFESTIGIHTTGV